MDVTASEFPPYSELMYPVLRAVQALGGSATGREITAQVIEAEGYTEEQMALTYPNRERSVLLDRMEWARSYCKLSGALDSPRRGLFLLSPLGREILALDESAAVQRLRELDRSFRAARPQKRKSPVTPSEPVEPVEPTHASDEAPPEAESEDSTVWTEAVLKRLHRLTPEGFEEFSLYLLRQYGLALTRRGGSGDEGIDGIGTAPLSEVFSATVAVQVKRYDPNGVIGREVVALFQRDASAVGAERCVLITLGRFSAPARKAASAVTPRVDLIDGERLCELMLDREIGVRRLPVVDEHWFDRFD
jgi:restriction system protein